MLFKKMPLRLNMGNSLNPSLPSLSVTLLSNQASATAFPVVHGEAAAIAGTAAAVPVWPVNATPADAGLRDRSPESTQAFDQAAPEPPAAGCAGHDENMTAVDDAKPRDKPNVEISTTTRVSRSRRRADLCLE